jgi:phosphoglycerate dehydrogenase-like enzyme
MDNVIITPHSSGASELSAHRSEDVFIENLPRFLSGDAMKNEIGL